MWNVVAASFGKDFCLFHDIWLCMYADFHEGVVCVWSYYGPLGLTVAFNKIVITT